MKKKNSRFGTVLRVKKHQEKLTQQQLRQIQEAHEKEQEELVRLHSQQQEAMDHVPHIGRARVTDLQAQRAFIFKLARQIDHQSGKVDELRGREDAKKSELTVRAQSRKMVEKLDEKHQAEEVKRVDRREQDTLDELANRSTHGT